jgi:hypothetical protein
MVVRIVRMGARHSQQLSLVTTKSRTITRAGTLGSSDGIQVGQHCCRDVVPRRGGGLLDWDIWRGVNSLTCADPSQLAYFSIQWCCCHRSLFLRLTKYMMRRLQHRCIQKKSIMSQEMSNIKSNSSCSIADSARIETLLPSPHFRLLR